MATTTRDKVIEDFKVKYLKFLDVLRELSEKKFKSPDQDMTMEIYRFHKVVVNPMEEAWAKLTPEEKDQFINIILRRPGDEDAKADEKPVP